MITYVKGDATEPQFNGIAVIAHVVNDCGGWGKGFVLSLSRRWDEPEEDYRNWVYKDNFKLGNISLVKVQGDKLVIEFSNIIYVCNMLAQHNYKSYDNEVPLNYRALRECLMKLGILCTHSLKVLHKTDNLISPPVSVHMPRIGCGLGGGSWEVVSELIDDCLDKVPVFVYDLD